MQCIVTSSGSRVMVSDEDFPVLSKHKWKEDKDGYPCRNHHHYKENRWETIRMSRVIMGCKVGDGKMVDHINGDIHDNRRENLRLIYTSCNAQNIKKRKSWKFDVPTSVYKGVCRHKQHGLYNAKVKIAGTLLFQGWYKDEGVAAWMYDLMVSEFYGKNARTNFLGGVA